MEQKEYPKTGIAVMIMKMGKVLEPEKCEGWAWYDLENLPQPLFKGCESCIEAYKTGQNYFDMWYDYCPIEI